MKITSLKTYSKEELLKRFRDVTLFRQDKTKPPVYIFRKATISLEASFPIQDIYPAQMYFLKESFARQKELQKFLQEKGIDMFCLNGFVSYKSGGKTYTLIPPVLEYTTLPDGREVAVIADGFHRISIAKAEKKKTIQVVVIRKIPEKYLYPAYPNPKGWQDVTIEGAPSDPAKKRLWRYPIEVAYDHYHDFGSVFENTTKPLMLAKPIITRPARYAVEEERLRASDDDFPPESF